MNAVAVKAHQKPKPYPVVCPARRFAHAGDLLLPDGQITAHSRMSVQCFAQKHIA